MQVFVNMFANIVATLRLVAFRAPSPHMIRATPGQILVSLCAPAVVAIGFDAAETWPFDTVSEWGVVTLLASAAAGLALAALALVLGGGGRAAGPMVVTLSYALALGWLLAGFAWRVWPETLPFGPLEYAVLAHTPATLVLLSGARRLAGAGLARAVGVAALFLAAGTASSMSLPRWPVFEEQQTAEAEDERPRVDVEAVYYAQAPLMAERIDALARQRPGVIDLYALVVAGYAHEGVFLREVEAVADLLADRFDAGGRVLTLANSDRDPMRHPLANAPNLTVALRAMAARMDPEEDIAVLFLTSHGGPDLFATTFWDLRTRDLTAQGLAGMLDASGLRNVVLVLSACHAGSFIDELAAPDRLLITAAAADRKSFGCSDANEWTWWGRAYFDTALRQTDDFRAAYDQAAALVAEWEQVEGYTPSLPQISLGQDIAVLLDRRSAQLAAATGR